MPDDEKLPSWMTGQDSSPAPPAPAPMPPAPAPAYAPAPSASYLAKAHANSAPQKEEKEPNWMKNEGPSNPTQPAPPTYPEPEYDQVPNSQKNTYAEDGNDREYQHSSSQPDWMMNGKLVWMCLLLKTHILICMYRPPVCGS